jgi:hypothetical protein
MADSRINLLTSASSTANDDFFVIDGATNGTRKLNAFSPTIGGSLSVTGTSDFGGLLRVTGGGFRSNGSMTLGTTYAVLGAGFQVTYDSPITRIFYGDGTGYSLRFATRASSTTTDRVIFTDTGDITASGGIYATSTLSTAVGLVAQNGYFNAGYITLTGFGDANGGLIYMGQASNNNFIVSNATNIATYIGNAPIANCIAAGLRVPVTTASTTTSTGALVVSGGMGLSGNLNMGGSLSVSGGNGFSLDTTGSASVRFNDSAVSKWWIYKLNADNNLYFRDMANSRMQMTLVPSTTSSTAISYLFSNLIVESTAVSTNTATGALVVSGGVGVGNEISVFGRVRAQLGLHADGNVPAGLAAAYQVDVQAVTTRDILSFGDSSRAGLLRGYQDGSGVVQFRFGRYPGSTFEEHMRLSGTTATNSSLTIYGTTASTTTASGALVVNGGVGVAGAINAGGAITSNNGSGSGQLGMRSSSGNSSYVFWSETGVSDRGILGFDSGSSTLSYRSGSSSFSTGTEVLSVTSAGNVTASGSMRTSAPAGGTSAAWKFGTVAAVTPTSPNRTIEVDINGVTYYLHAKTTNN